MAYSEKFKAAVHYICHQCQEDPSKLGAVKLNKILWMADFVAFYETGESITGARYNKHKFGPVPHLVMPVINDLVRSGSLFIEEPNREYGTRLFYSRYAPDMSDFSEQERDELDRAIEYVCNNHTATSISNLSHDHIWKAAAIGEEIPYFTVFANPGLVTRDERQWAMHQIEEMNASA